MSHTELPSILLAIASLLLTLYFGLRYKKPANENQALKGRKSKEIFKNPKVYTE